MSLAQHARDLCIGRVDFLLARGLRQKGHSVSPLRIHSQCRRVGNHDRLVLVVAHETALGFKKPDHFEAQAVDVNMFSDNCFVALELFDDRATQDDHLCGGAHVDGAEEPPGIDKKAANRLVVLADAAHRNLLGLFVAKLHFGVVRINERRQPADIRTFGPHGAHVLHVQLQSPHAVGVAATREEWMNNHVLRPVSTHHLGHIVAESFDK